MIQGPETTCRDRLGICSKIKVTIADAVTHSTTSDRQARNNESRGTRGRQEIWRYGCRVDTKPRTPSSHQGKKKS
ncbi:Uncharacterized protein HZ326_18867 [Fusarium oxysporum f. sp. albedinis]|nr:Uncharacterized protein HZ326_18867 [Fusarium oxysporum f. sp. albedinis]